MRRVAETECSSGTSIYDGLPHRNLVDKMSMSSVTHQETLAAMRAIRAVKLNG